jgi:hypothetical protein
VRFTWIRVSKPKLLLASPGSPPGAEAPWRFTLGLLWPRPPQFPGGSPSRPEPVRLSRGSLFKPKSESTLRWIAVSTEVSAAFRGFLPSTEVSSSSPWIPVWTEVRSVLLRTDVLAEAASSLLWRAFSGRSRSRVSWSAVRTEVLAALPDPGLGRSPCRSPFGVPSPAEAFSVHLSGSSVGRSRSVSSGRKACQPRLATFPVGSPFGPKPFRFSSRSTFQPELTRSSGLDPRQSSRPGGFPSVVP